MYWLVFCFGMRMAVSFICSSNCALSSAGSVLPAGPAAAAVAALLSAEAAIADAQSERPRRPTLMCAAKKLGVWPLRSQLQERRGDGDGTPPNIALRAVYLRHRRSVTSCKREPAPSCQGMQQCPKGVAQCPLRTALSTMPKTN